MAIRLDDLAKLRRSGTPRGITSVCSAHPIVLRAALRHGAATGATVLIEATCNQVNHLGGYTGMLPAGFAKLVFAIAKDEGCPKELIVLGGDHLGPNPWRDQPAGPAMDEAEMMIAAYVAAGIRKIHFDASMRCADEPPALDDATTAERTVRLAGVAEEVVRSSGGDMPRYIIGTEVPPPGGADHVLDCVTPTDPNSALDTIRIHQAKFADSFHSDAFERVIGVVVQPGVEFGNHNVIRYDREMAQSLVRVLDEKISIGECPIFCVSVIWFMLPERSKDDDDFQGITGRTAEGLRAA